MPNLSSGLKLNSLGYAKVQGWKPSPRAVLRGLFLSEVNNRDNTSGYWGEEWNVLSQKTNGKVPAV